MEDLKLIPSAKRATSSSPEVVGAQVTCTSDSRAVWLSPACTFSLGLALQRKHLEMNNFVSRRLYSEIGSDHHRLRLTIKLVNGWCQNFSSNTQLRIRLSALAVNESHRPTQPVRLPRCSNYVTDRPKCQCASPHHLDKQNVVCDWPGSCCVPVYSRQSEAKLCSV